MSTERWGKRRRRDHDDHHRVDSEELYQIDLYDDTLQDIKQLANERNNAPEKHKRAYDLAIDKLVDVIQENFHDDIPFDMMIRDIEEAKKGGKFRRLLAPNISDDIIYLRHKKKSVKPKRKLIKKPKRKVVKKSNKR